jgi:hypothetical protein
LCIPKAESPTLTHHHAPLFGWLSIEPVSTRRQQQNHFLKVDFFANQGLAPHQAAGIVGDLQGESAQQLDPSAVNRGDSIDSIGIGQRDGARAQALKDHAPSKGVPWTDLDAQLEFLHSELKGPESAAYKRLTAAQAPPPFFAPRKPIDLSGPRAALANHFQRKDNAQCLGSTGLRPQPRTQRRTARSIGRRAKRHPPSTIPLAP